MAAFPSNPAHTEPGPSADGSALVDADSEPGLSAEASATTGDRSYDFSLRTLTVLVLVALVGSVALLAYRWVAPQLAEFENGPVTVTTAQPKPAPAKASAGPAHSDEVLMDPGHVFRCEEQGRVTFSDRACTDSTGAKRAATPEPGH
jgi:hypothetical protein